MTSKSVKSTAACNRANPTTSFGRKALWGVALAALAASAGFDRSQAAEAGNLLQTLPGASIDAPFAVPLPPGWYGSWENFATGNLNGTGQVGGLQTRVLLTAPELIWSTGYDILGAKLTMAIIQPFTEAYAPSPPLGQTQWNWATANTIITPALLSWNLGNGFFAGTGISFIVPDGSRYDGVTNPDYFTYEPRASFAWYSKDWHLSANFKYDINTASAGHTGAYQTVASAANAQLTFLHVPASIASATAAQIASIGNGYQTGQIAYVDLAATYHVGRWEFGPVGSLKLQTTDDSPGSGFSCAQLKSPVQTGIPGVAVPVPGCGKAENIQAGALVGYNFGSAVLQVYATDSVFTQDDFAGWSVYSRLTFKLP
jgi:hypothetical protein